MADLRLLYGALELPEDASTPAKQRRGRAFETFLSELLAHEGLSPRIRLRPSGEEIDGSLELDGKTYLLEAKWHATALPASSIYAFKGKVDGKLVGTIGLFVSMSGYGENVVDAVTAGKVLNVLLFDRADVEAALEHGFSRVLRAKVRAAAEEGIVLFPFTSLVSEVRGDRRTDVGDAPTDKSETDHEQPEVVVICEGSADARIISILGRRVLEQIGSAATLRVVAAQGKQSIPRLANALSPLLRTSGPIVTLIDAEGDVDAATRTVMEQVRAPLELIPVDPGIEAWLYPAADDPRAEAKAAARRKGVALERHLDAVSESTALEGLLRSAPGFQPFYEAVRRAAGLGVAGASD